MSGDVPPRLATWLLSRLLPERDRDAVLGDLVEEYALRLRSASPSTVSRWYWGQVYRSIPPVLACTIRRGRWLGTIAVAGAVYLVIYIRSRWPAWLRFLRLLGLDAPLRLLSVIVGLTTNGARRILRRVAAPASGHCSRGDCRDCCCDCHERRCAALVPVRLPRRRSIGGVGGWDALPQQAHEVGS